MTARRPSKGPVPVFAKSTRWVILDFYTTCAIYGPLVEPSPRPAGPETQAWLRGVSLLLCGGEL